MVPNDTVYRPRGALPGRVLRSSQSMRRQTSAMFAGALRPCRWPPRLL